MRWILFLSILSVLVIVVLAIFAGMVLTLTDTSLGAATISVADSSGSDQLATSTPQFELPTAMVPTATVGPVIPESPRFVAQTPIQGYSDCDIYGFYGQVVGTQGEFLTDVQVVIWEESAVLLALDSTDDKGRYQIKITDQRQARNLWVQLYQDDVPVSDPLSLETQADCQSGFQIYQIDWQALSEK
ncbi:MAG: hypothetical protein AAF485_31395 [Chloroflexota bacterium]